MAKSNQVSSAHSDEVRKRRAEFEEAKQLATPLCFDLRVIHDVALRIYLKKRTPYYLDPNVIVDDAWKRVLHWLARHPGEQIRNPVGYVKQMGRRALLSAIKKENRRRKNAVKASVVKTPDAAVSSRSEPPRVAATGEASERILAFIATWPELDQKLIRLRIWEQMTAKEVGQLLGIAETTAQKRYSRLLLKLRERFPTKTGDSSYS